MELIKRCVLLFFLASLVYRGFSHTLSFQMDAPAFRISGNDLLIWLYNLSGLNYFIFENYTYSLIFNALLFGFWLLAFSFIRKKGFAIVFYFLFLLYALGFNANIGFTSSYLKGLIIIGFIFFINKSVNFELMWDALRYYACWLYFSAFVLKFLNRAIFMPRFGEMTFKDNMSWYIYLNPNSILTDIYLFFIKNSWMLNIGDKIVFLFEGLFVIGFLTKKYDRFLGWGIVGLHLFLYFFSDTLFAEIFVLALPFISVKSWQKITKILGIRVNPSPASL